MKKSYAQRQVESGVRLNRLGALHKAQKWLRKNPPRFGWQGTTLEYAELEMPLGISGLWKKFKNWLFIE